MLERAEKKLLLEMVNKESKDAKFDQDDTARGLSAGELLEDIKFGCQAIFGNSGHNELPSWEDIENITDRSRKDSDSAGKLKGGTSNNAQSFNAEAEFSSSHFFGGADFQAIRREQAMKEKQAVPKNLKGIAHLWKEIKTLDSKRSRKSRIVLLDGMGSGYGSASIPVLASNNYDLLKGESSVFDRELTSSNKVNFQVKKRAKSKKHENQDFCQVSNCVQAVKVVLNLCRFVLIQSAVILPCRYVETVVRLPCALSVPAPSILSALVSERPISLCLALITDAASVLRIDKVLGVFSTPVRAAPCPFARIVCQPRVSLFWNALNALINWALTRQSMLYIYIAAQFVTTMLEKN